MAKWALRIGSLAAAVAAAVAYAGWRWVTPPREPPPDPQGVTGQDVFFPSLDGTRLHGLYLEGRADYPTVVLCHGYIKSLAEPYEIGLSLHQAGYNVFLLDFRASGKSGGRFTTLGYKETWDVLAAVRYVRDSYRRLPIGVLGISMGASAAIMAAVHSGDIAALVADSPFAQAEDVVRKKLGDFLRLPWLVPLAWLSVRLGEELAGGRLREVRPMDSLGRLASRPTLFIYGEKDSYIPPEQRQALLAAAGAAKEAWIAPGADHAMARVDHPQEYRQRVQQFFDRYLLGDGVSRRRGRRPRRAPPRRGSPPAPHPGAEPG